MALDVDGITDALVSHAASLGRFERVNTHEPKNAPGNGLTAAVWLQRLGPAVGFSGVASTAARLVFTLRIYQNMLAEPADAIDPLVLAAVSQLVGEYSGDFDLGGRVMCVDLLGMAGVALEAQAGYLEQDRRMFRVVDLTIPMIVDDVWGQNA